MALTLHPDSGESISLAEAVSCGDFGTDECSLDQLVDNAWILKALTNNRNFLTKLIEDDIRRALAGEKTAIYSPQSISLGSARSVTFRANLWLIPTQDKARQDFESALYSYGLAHDHNFNFVTVGYHGSGYRTDIYEYDREKVIGYPGEKVDIRFLASTSLPQGKVMAFRSKRDIHTQRDPEEFSISINMMARDKAEAAHPQFCFDVDRGQLVRMLDNQVSGMISLIRTAKVLGNDETFDLMSDIAGAALPPFVRAAAYDVLLSKASEEERERVTYRIRRDRDEHMEMRIRGINHL